MNGRPVLLHVGYVKTGSTWLQRNFTDNAALGLKELFRRGAVRDLVIAPYPLWYDVTPVRQAIAEGMAACREVGAVPVVTHERLTGSAVAGGYDAPILAQRLAELFPSGRVLLLFREQRDHLRSIYSEYVNGGGACSLETFTFPPLVAKVPLFDLRFLEFDRIIRVDHELFGERAVLALPFELFKRDPVAFCNRVLTFVGLDRVVDSLPTDPVRVSHGALTLTLLRHANLLFYRGNSNPAAPVHWPTGRRIARAVGRLVPRAVHDAVDRRRRRWIDQAIGDRFDESNRRTADLTRFDLGTFGYRV